MTLRYTKNFGAKTAKLRVPTKKDEPDWWIDVMAILARPSRLVSATGDIRYQLNGFDCTASG